MAMCFLPKMLYSSHLFTLLLFYEETVDSTFCHFFLYCNVDLFFMLRESGFLTKYSSARFSERKNKRNIALGGRKVSAFSWSRESVIAGVCFSHFFMCFARGAGFCPRSRGVRNSEVSERRESTVYVLEIQASLQKKMLNVRYCLNCLTRDVRWLVHNMLRKNKH